MNGPLIQIDLKELNSFFLAVSIRFNEKEIVETPREKNYLNLLRCRIDYLSIDITIHLILPGEADRSLTYS